MTPAILPSDQPYATGVWKAWLSFLIVLSLSISGFNTAQNTSQADQQIDFSTQLHQVTFALTQETLRLQHRDNTSLTPSFDGPQDQPELALWRGAVHSLSADLSQADLAVASLFVWQSAPYQLPDTRAPPSFHV